MKTFCAILLTVFYCRFAAARAVVYAPNTQYRNFLQLATFQSPDLLIIVPKGWSVDTSNIPRFKARISLYNQSSNFMNAETFCTLLVRAHSAKESSSNLRHMKKLGQVSTVNLGKTEWRFVKHNDKNANGNSVEAWQGITSNHDRDIILIANAPLGTSLVDTINKIIEGIRVR